MGFGGASTLAYSGFAGDAIERADGGIGQDESKVALDVKGDEQAQKCIKRRAFACFKPAQSAGAEARLLRKLILAQTV